MINLVDSIESPQTTGAPIPDAIRHAQAVAAYNHGNSWPTAGPYAAARPDLVRKGWLVTITLTCLGKARCYDIEPGGGSNRNIGVFMRNADRSDGLPWLYTFASNVGAMVAAAGSFGFHQGHDFYVWSAHTGRGRHICAPDVCGYPKADGTQYEFLPGNCDLSVVNDYMLPGTAPKPAPAPAPAPKPVQHASGLFIAELRYDHDQQKVAIIPQPGDVKAWGDANERIKLEANLEVGEHNPKRGQWSGHVIGTEPA